MTYSEQINLVENYLKNELNFKVEFFANDLPEDISGRTIYNEELIKINEPTAEEALFTLLHEAGHAYSYRKYFTKLGLSQPDDVSKRETYAYLYGYGIAKMLKLNITKEMWINSEKQYD